MFSGWFFWQILVVGLGVFLMGMSKGGLKVGSICVPMMILVWPDQDNAGREVVAFMLPLLCTMDLVAVLFYRKHILWERIVPILPGTLAGIVVASVFFLGNSPVLTVSDRWLKLGVGLIGLGFVGYQLGRKQLAAKLEGQGKPSACVSGVLGLAAGVTSTIAHAAGPIGDMYFLPQNLRKMNLVATVIGFFWVLNLAKLIPFGIFGRLHVHNLSMGLAMLPLVPLGVGCGYLLIKVMKPHHYLRFVYVMLTVSSVALIVKAM